MKNPVVAATLALSLFFGTVGAIAFAQEPTMTNNNSPVKHYEVVKPLTSTEDIEFNDIGKSGASGATTGIDTYRALLEAITTQEDVRTLLVYLHLRLNERGLGKGLDILESKSVEGQNAWSDILNKHWMDPSFYERLSQVVDNKSVAADFTNIAALTIIAKNDHKAQAVDYIHQIIHDLDVWVYNNKVPGEEVSHFGIAHAEAGTRVKEVEQYIHDNLKSK